jgi:hypothetical protein
MGATEIGWPVLGIYLASNTSRRSATVNTIQGLNLFVFASGDSDFISELLK